MSRKLTYAVGSTWSVGKPTMAKIGFGRFVTLVGTTEGNKRAIVQNPENPEQTAEVKFANLGNTMLDGREFDVVSQKFTPVKAAKAASIPEAVKAAYQALTSYQAEAGDVVSGGKARKLGRLRDALTAALGEAGLTFEQVAPTLAS